jgi:hypothetical protein
LALIGPGEEEALQKAAAVMMNRIAGSGGN